MSDIKQSDQQWDSSNLLLRMSDIKQSDENWDSSNLLLRMSDIKQSDEQWVSSNLLLRMSDIEQSDEQWGSSNWLLRMSDTKWQCVQPNTHSCLVPTAGVLKSVVLLFRLSSVRGVFCCAHQQFILRWKHDTGKNICIGETGINLKMK
jgi:hypothetical protein